LENRGFSGNTLNDKINKAETDIMIQKSILKGNKSLKDAEYLYKNHIEIGSSFQDSNFSSSYIIRNTTAHSLLWPDQFTSTNSYTTLYNNLINSIFWCIEKLWLK